ncbi:MAG: SpoIID/LytB domain-containing protein, partial [Paramuribaculum sp.]|nr:SpoIID/LytB domain-containing protein [Paramuribaculum sp.]
MTTPTITAGILRAKEIKVTLAGQFTFNEKPVKAGQFTFGVDGHFVTSGGELYDEVRLVPKTPDSRFTLHDVTIGIDFHWQQREDQTFGGELQLLVFRDEVQAINCINVEDYLLSVISSEMNAEAPEEFLKAHAVISRSWALAQVEACFDDSDYFEPMVKEDETVMWYDHCAHTIFDVCADDHCQRYQGVTRATTPAAERAIEATCGELLTFDGDLCDTRFSKCCGGISERFSTC